GARDRRRRADYRGPPAVVAAGTRAGRSRAPSPCDPYAAKPLSDCAAELAPARLRELPVGCVPVDDVPPGREIVGALVLVLEVVRVLPDVDAEDRHVVEGLQDRAVLVRRRVDGEAGAVPDEPRPAGAEPLHARVVHLRPERVERVERVVD